MAALLFSSCATALAAREPLFPLPGSITFAGERVADAGLDGSERIWNWYNYFLSRPWAIALWIERAQSLFPTIDRELSEAGVPLDLRYLAVAESALYPRALSSSGAAGIWQFMPMTAELYGLRVGSFIDERYDFGLETQAAVAYFRKAHEELGGSWLLVCASYNAGIRAIKQRIAEQKNSDYWSMVFPSETDNYVPKIIAIKLIMEDARGLGFEPPSAQAADPPLGVTVSAQANPIYLADIAMGTGLSFRALWLDNPQILKPYLPPGSYTLYLPAPAAARVDELNRYLASLPYELSSYTVAPKDTLTSIAERLDTSVAELSGFNELDASKPLAVGAKLRFWRRLATPW